MNLNPVILITGASSGIGKAAATHFRQQGWTVFAGARRLERMTDLRQLGCHVLPLDVTDEASCQHFVQQAVATAGRIDVLVNNAGYGPLGPMEVYDPQEMRSVFETNVFGLVRLSQLVLPHMRAKGQGRIIHVGSMGGDFTTPYAGVYHASKYAVESVGDAMRFEVQPFGIHVSIVKPAAVNTGLVTDTMQQAYGMQGIYAPFMQRMLEVSKRSMANPRSLIAPQAVAASIYQAATAKRPKARYVVGMQARLFILLRRMLPITWWDGLWRALLKPKTPAVPAAAGLSHAA